MKTSDNQENPWRKPKFIETQKVKFYKDNPWYPKGMNIYKYLFTVFPIQLVIGFSSGIIAGFCQLPIFTFHIFFLIFNISWTSLYSLVLAYLINTALIFVIEALSSQKERLDLFNYVQQLELAYFKVQKYKLSEFVIEKGIFKKLNFHNYSDGKDETSPLGVVYRLIPPKGVEVGGLKAFVSTNYPNPENNPFFEKAYGAKLNSYKSYLFVRDSPAELNSIGYYFLFHEIGHITEEARGLSIIRIQLIISLFIFPIMFYFFYSCEIIYAYLFLVPYTLFVIYDQKKFKTIDKVERFCDTFAIHLLGEKNDFKKLRECLKILFIDDESRYNNISLSIDRKINGLNVYVHGHYNIYPKRKKLFFISLLILFSSVVFFDSDFHNSMLLTITIIIISLSITIYLIHLGSKFLIEIQSKLESMET